MRGERGRDVMEGACVTERVEEDEEGRDVVSEDHVRALYNRRNRKEPD